MGINKSIWTAHVRSESGFGFTLYELGQKVKKERERLTNKEEANDKE